MVSPVSRPQIEEAFSRISGHVRRTPVLQLGEIIGSGWELILKLEHLQVAGSFKPRGAFALLTSADIPKAGVVAASGGNFGRAVAYASERLGIVATVFVPATSPPEKIQPIAAHGARLEVVDGYYDDAYARAVSRAEESGALLAHPYDHHDVVAGQGTIGMEIANQVPEADTVLVAVGGGGLIAGVAGWFAGATAVVAVEPVSCPSFNFALAAGAPVDAPVGGVAASSLGARRIGDHAWAARKWITASTLVSDEEIETARAWLWEQARLAVEPAAATPVAALLSGNYQPAQGDRVVAVISGANTAGPL